MQPNALQSHEADLQAMMRRRHLIVHRADKAPNRIPGRGIRRTQHLKRQTVQTWLDTVVAVGRKIIGGLTLPQDGAGDE